MTDDATYDELMRDLLEQVYLLECSRLGIVARMHGLFISCRFATTLSGRAIHDR